MPDKDLEELEQLRAEVNALRAEVAMRRATQYAWQPYEPWRPYTYDPWRVTSQTNMVTNLIECQPWNAHA